MAVYYRMIVHCNMNALRARFRCSWSLFERRRRTTRAWAEQPSKVCANTLLHRGMPRALRNPKLRALAAHACAIMGAKARQLC